MCNKHQEQFIDVCIIHYYLGEWISGAVCMYIVNELVTKYGQTEGQAEEVSQ